MRLLKKCLTFILCLTLLMQGAAYAFTYENGTELSSSDLSFQSTNGEEIRVSDLLQERKMVLIHFFQTVSKASRSSFPALEASYERWKDRAEVIGISCDAMDTREYLNDFAKDNGLTFPLVAGNETILPDLFGLTAVPTTVVVDRFGAVAMLMVDVKTDPASYDRIFDYFCSDDYTQSVWLTSLPPARASAIGPTEEALTEILTKDSRIRVTGPASPYIWPFLKGEESGVRSSNTGMDDSISPLSAHISAPSECVFSYRFNVSSERLYDALIILLDGNEVRVYSGETGWQQDALTLSAGEHEIAFHYLKDEEAGNGSDCAMLADFALLEGEAAEKTLEQLPDYPVSDQTAMTLHDQDAQEIWVEDPTGVLERDFGGPVRIYLLDQPQAHINLSLASQYNPWTVYLKAGNSIEIQEVLPYQTENGYELTVDCAPDTFSLYTAFTAQPYEQQILYNIIIFPNMDTLENWFSYMKYVRLAKLLWNVGSDEEEELFIWQVKVQDTAGNPVPGCEVTFSNKEASASVITDEKGMAVFESAEETYRVSLSAVPNQYINPSSREVVMPRTGGTTGFILVKKEGRKP